MTTYQHDRRVSTHPPEPPTHMQQHLLCSGRTHELRLGDFVSRIWRCAVCGREEWEVVYRPRWWARVLGL